MPRQRFPISSWWFQGAIITYLFGFAVLGLLAYFVYDTQPPIPSRVVAEDGRTLFTKSDIIGGMNVFQRYGLMEYGTVYGHGAYLGPDFTADYLHRAAEMLSAQYGPQQMAREFHGNGYDARTDTLVWSQARAAAHGQLAEQYRQMFQNRVTSAGMQPLWIADREAVNDLVAFFAWTAWTATANRPGRDYSYTNNWPPEALVGNSLTADAVTWSVISIIFLLGGAGVILYFFGRYDWLGWRERAANIRLKPVEAIALTPAQRAVTWFLLVMSVLFVLQTLLGGLAAHYRAEPNGFFGFDIAQYLPYNIARTWHLQLAIFWVSASFLATGIFIVPLIGGREPRGQRFLALALLGAVAVVVFGSLIGEYAGIRGWLKGEELWFWVGDQGWEYLDLGRFWQILLIIGLFLWVFLIFRGLRPKLRESHFAQMPWLLFYAALAIPVFYAVGLLASPNRGFVVTDFWRFWVVHLWVEDFLELFTTVVVAYMFVLLGMVRRETALRVVYLDIILYSIGGVIGTMHHLYFSGTPSAYLALGASFSAMEVIPLLLLSLEAWAFMRSGERSVMGEHPHRWAVRFLVAVGIWNFFGAGVFGFLINLPVVSYYEIGTNLTANHGHTAMMGVYGMLAVGLMLFCLRFLLRPDKWSERMAKVSFWSLNIGLAWMAFANLFPVGIVQLHTSVSDGYWHARNLSFLLSRWVNILEWARLPGDALFIAGGALPLFVLAFRAIRYPSQAREQTRLEQPAALYEGEAD